MTEKECVHEWIAGECKCGVSYVEYADLLLEKKDKQIAELKKTVQAWKDEQLKIIEERNEGYRIFEQKNKELQATVAMMRNKLFKFHDDHLGCVGECGHEHEIDFPDGKK